MSIETFDRPALAHAMRTALAAATANVAEGGGPFGAVVLAADGAHYLGVNRVTRQPPDPTAHAEVVAIRAAAAGLGTHELSGCVLVSSCQPCPMCLAAALWARVEGIAYAATASDAERAGFDDARFYDQLRGGLDTVTDTEVLQLDVGDRLAPFRAWAANPDRTPY